MPQACALSLLMFTGASQFAFVGLIGGGAAAAVATALLLGARNALYGLRLAPYPAPAAARRALRDRRERRDGRARHARRHAARASGRPALAVFVFWNLATLLGALGRPALSDPRALGLDAAAPAAFLALLAPRLREREPQAVAALAAAAALISVPLVPAGTPVLVAAAVGGGRAMAAARRGAARRGVRALARTARRDARGVA